MKKVLIVLGVLAVLAVVGVVLLLSNLGPIVKASIETIGSKATGAPVTVESVEISLSDGTASIANLVVGNPPGFNTESAIRIGLVSVTLDKDSLTTDTILIPEVVIAGPEVTYELGAGGSNIGVIEANVKAFSGGGGDEADEADETAEAPAGDEGAGGGGAASKEEEGGKKIVIENLHVREGKINVSATILGGKKMGASLPAAHVEDIGKEDGGATPGEVASEILLALTGDILGAVKGLDLGGAGEAVKGGVEEAGKALKGLFGK